MLSSLSSSCRAPAGVQTQHPSRLPKSCVRLSRCHATAARCPGGRWPQRGAVGRAPPSAPGRGRLQVAAAVKQQFSSFDDMIANSEVPLLIDWYATWCGPCQVQSAELEVFAQRMGGAVKVVKIDTEKYPNLSSRYAVQGLPTLMLVRNGKVLNRWEGLVQAPALADQVRYYLGAAA
mmetsp:Transcript_19405/g.49851  ORF Transcript_19405/g.49851 Transcript_19405/m.49851 type:complete len:177 (+) Transcript_19405:379-909(+)|eukprot:jgi/Tetstr1/422401/TSEL_013239.t1